MQGIFSLLPRVNQCMYSYLGSDFAHQPRTRQPSTTCSASFKLAPALSSLRSFAAFFFLARDFLFADCFDGPFLASPPSPSP